MDNVPRELPKTKRRRLIEFFEEFEANLNAAILCDGPGAQAAAAAFETNFVISDEASVRCGTNDAAFAASIQDRCNFYRRVGIRSLRLEGIDSSPIDQDHVTARLHWIGEFQRPGASPIRVPFDVVYFVRMAGAEFRIFGCVAGAEERALKEHGLVE